jgi:hypothetical protein
MMSFTWPEMTSERAIVGLTIVLAVATIYYAWQTQRMVREMRAARSAQVAPVLVPTLMKLGGGGLLPRLVNAGVGPALRVRVVLALEPSGPNGAYQASFVSPGRGQVLLMEKPSAGGAHKEYVTDAEDLAPFTSLHLTGECVDALGDRIVIDERLDLTEFLELFNTGMWGRLPTIDKSGDPMQLIADAVVNIENLKRIEMEGD